MPTALFAPDEVLRDLLDAAARDSAVVTEAAAEVASSTVVGLLATLQKPRLLPTLLELLYGPGASL